MAIVKMTAPKIGTFDYNTDAGIALPQGATPVSGGTIPGSSVPKATSTTTTGTIPTANVPKAPTTSTSGTSTATIDPAAQQYGDYQKQISDLMTQLKSYAQPMNYNPATDPQAIAYKQYYDNLAKQGSQNAMEELNNRGILNSSITAGEVANAEQNANLAYGTKVADLGQQFYNRQQDQFNNTSKLIGLLGDQQQRELDNTYRNEQLGLQKDQLGLQKQGQEANYTGYYTPDQATIDAVQKKMAANSAAYATASPEEQQRLHNENVALAASIGGKDTTGNGDYVYGPMRTVQGQQLDLNQANNQRDFAYQQARDAIKDAQYQQKFDEDVSEFGMQYALNKAVQLGQLSVSQANSAISAQNAALNQAKFNYETDPNNVDNRYKESEIAKNNSPKAKSPDSYKTDPNFSADVAHMKANPNDVSKLDSNAQAFIDAYGYDGYVALRKAAGLD